MNLYQRLGYLVLGSRLRRISETFLSEITRAYQQQGIDFEAAWFPVFYLLAEHNELSIKELSEQTEVSHPAASQLVTGLKNKGLLKSVTSAVDGRKQLITLTDKGQKILETVRPVWDAVVSAMEEITTPGCEHLLSSLAELETALQTESLAAQISKRLNHE